MSQPQRIQRKRSKGWRMPEGAIYVGRPTQWGNPFSVREDREAWTVEGPNGVVASGLTFRAAVTLAVRDYMTLVMDHNKWEKWVGQLRGKDLACWCPLADKDGNPVPCHADVLLELANREEAP